GRDIVLQVRCAVDVEGPIPAHDVAGGKGHQVNVAVQNAIGEVLAFLDAVDAAAHLALKVEPRKDALLQVGEQRLQEHVVSDDHLAEAQGDGEPSFNGENLGAAHGLHRGGVHVQLNVERIHLAEEKLQATAEGDVQLPVLAGHQLPGIGVAHGV